MAHGPADHGLPVRRALIAGAAALGVVAGGHALVWRWAVQTVADQYAQWAAQQRVSGWTIASAEPSRGGWPLAAELTLPQARAETPERAVPRLSWSSERVVLGVALLHPRTLVVRAEGMQRLRIGQGTELPFTTDHLRATVPIEPGVPARAVDVSVENLRAGLPVRGQPANGLTVALLSLHADSKPAAVQGEAALSFAGSAQDVGLPPPPPGRAWPFGARVASVSVEGEVTGPVPPRLRSASQGERLAGRWRHVRNPPPRTRLGAARA